MNLKGILAFKFEPNNHSNPFSKRMKYLFLMILLVLVSCKQHEEKKPLPVTLQQEEATEESHESIDGKVTLNEGKLWQANPETTTGINKMKNRMRAFTDTENLKAYATLKEGLEADFTELFQKCTMKGEPHNQLHNYLFPFIDLFDGLESADLDGCKMSFSNLNIRLKEYADYFE